MARDENKIAHKNTLLVKIGMVLLVPVSFAILGLVFKIFVFITFTQPAINDKLSARITNTDRCVHVNDSCTHVEFSEVNKRQDSDHEKVNQLNSNQEIMIQKLNDLLDFYGLRGRKKNTCNKTSENNLISNNH